MKARKELKKLKDAQQQEVKKLQEEEKAATKIQSLFRGMKARKELKKLKEPKGLKKQEEDIREQAAIKIQRAFRTKLRLEEIEFLKAQAAQMNKKEKTKLEKAEQKLKLAIENLKKEQARSEPREGLITILESNIATATQEIDKLTGKFIPEVVDEVKEKEKRIKEYSNMSIKQLYDVDYDFKAMVIRYEKLLKDPNINEIQRTLYKNYMDQFKNKSYETSLILEQKMNVDKNIKRILRRNEEYSKEQEHLKNEIIRYKTSMSKANEDLEYYIEQYNEEGLPSTKKQIDSHKRFINQSKDKIDQYTKKIDELEKMKDEPLEKDLNPAAIKIQSLFRGMKARKELKKLKEEKKAKEQKKLEDLTLTQKTIIYNAIYIAPYEYRSKFEKIIPRIQPENKGTYFIFRQLPQDKFKDPDQLVKPLENILNGVDLDKNVKNLLY
jgi:hypothetical protein